jgi:hypothetical protein
MLELSKNMSIEEFDTNYFYLTELTTTATDYVMHVAVKNDESSTNTAALM